MDSEKFALGIAKRLSGVQGVLAVVIGGSRGRGTHQSTSDLDIGIYYDPSQALDISELDQLAADLDDSHHAGLVTPIGGWGPWINGGGWLTVQGQAVDFIYRDITLVNQVIQDCCKGIISMHYQPGHPHGFCSHIYMGEVALCKPLFDPKGALESLRLQTNPYPPALGKAVIAAFFWEAGFSMQIARKGASRGDVAYVAGSCFRSIACLLQTLFALNNVYWLNEKGALEICETFSRKPVNLRDSIESIFANMSRDPDRLNLAIDRLEQLIKETQSLLA